ncbi:MAG: CHAT domain-containing tetratricopeptide repeat protein [Chitinophagaceae bacterium]
MGSQPKNLILLVLIYLSGQCSAQNVQGQFSSLHDSLRHNLTYFFESVKDEKIRGVIKDVQALYTSDSINDSLSRKLIVAEELLAKNSGLNRERIISCAKTISFLLAELPPRGEHPDYAISLVNLGVLNRQIRRYDTALFLYQKALPIIKSKLGDKHAEYVSTLSNLAIVYDYMGRLDKALPLQQQAASIKKEILGEDDPSYLSSLVDLADLYESMGQYDTSLARFQQALTIVKRTSPERHPDYATILSSTARLYVRMGRYYKALPLFQLAASSIKQAWGVKHPTYATTLNEFAGLYVYIGQFDKALNLIQEAVNIRKGMPEEKMNYASNINNLGRLYSRIGQYEKALPLIEEAVKIRKEILGEKHPDYALSLNSLSILYERQGRYDKALPLCQQALNITKAALGEGHPSYAISLHVMARLLVRTGEYNAALPFYKQSIEITSKVYGEKCVDNVINLNGLASLYTLLNNYKEAALVYINALNIELAHLTNTYSTLSEQEKIILLNKEAFQFTYLPSLLFLEAVDQPLLANQIYTNELTLKGMILEDQQAVLNSIRKSGESNTLHLYENWRTNKAFLGKQLLLPLVKRVPYLDSLTETSTQLEQQLSRASASFRSQLSNSNISTNHISPQLLKHQAAIEFISFQLYDKRWTDSVMYAALVVLPNDSAVHFVPLCEERQLKHLLRPAYATAMKADSPADYSRGVIVDAASSLFSDSMYLLIWKPLEKILSNTHTVYYAPSGLLNRVAFDALRVDSAHLLIDKYQLNQVLSTRSIVQNRRMAQKPASVSLWGNIDYDANDLINITRSGTDSVGNSTDMYTGDAPINFNFFSADVTDMRTLASGGSEWKALPGTKQELKSLHGIFRSYDIRNTINSDTSATEEAFKAMDGKSPQILHLATHGFFLPVADNKVDDKNPGGGGGAFNMQQNPMFRSGLVMAGGNRAWKGEEVPAGREDGILTAYEIAQLDLSGTDLVVLSACETALGDLAGNEGVLGLQRAFKMAGVKEMIVSLWPVPDKQTGELMSLFYRNLLNGESNRKAFRKAQLNMKRKYDPFYWAAFKIVE